MNNRAERRREARLDRLIDRVIRTRGDHCGICGRPFINCDETFYGSAFGVIAVTGNCCRAKIDWLIAAGIYIAKVRP